jgi:hypothetical protein
LIKALLSRGRGRSSLLALLVQKYKYWHLTSTYVQMLTLEERNVKAAAEAQAAAEAKARAEAEAKVIAERAAAEKAAAEAKVVH